MTETPCPARHRAALILRLSEAALAPGGWQAVAAALEAAIPGARLDRADGTPVLAPGLHRLTIEGLGRWTLALPDEDAPHVLSLPLTRILAFAGRLADGQPIPETDMETVLDALPYAAILLDAGARLLFANAAGEDLLRSRRLFRPARRGAPLRPASPADEARLDAAAARLLDGASQRAGWTLDGPAPDARLALGLRTLGPSRPAPGAARLLLTLRAIARAF